MCAGRVWLPPAKFGLVLSSLRNEEEYDKSHVVK
ncbi:hypothetical protein SAMN04515668_3721 [Hymenobacter arizonensis]|uniref:Uncharacterized protein n=1 Tax=Hymenobacter arizonensis TaxID=1227077 RepID=A0A1I6AIN6_HYMAR|nr:hypothetical protein SAMN04515668_3721 [Hymenobacter arizonensis]